MWEPHWEAGLPGARTRPRVNALGFLSAPAPHLSTQWVPFVIVKSPPISPSKSRQIQVEFNTQTLTQRLGLIAGFVWAQMCSSLEGGAHFSCHLSQTGWLHTEGWEGRRGGEDLHGLLLQGTTPDLAQPVSSWGLVPTTEDTLLTTVLSHQEPLGRPSFPFQQVTLSLPQSLGSIPVLPRPEL